jgi:hypothetical protein
MSAEQLDDKTRERQRLLALLALTSQEMPRSHPDSRELHDYLDADVEAFEALVARYRAEKSAQSATKTRFVARLAAGIAAVAVLTAIVLTMLASREEPLQAALDRSYAQLAPATLVEPSLPSSQAAAPLGFSSAQRASVASRSFAAGVAVGEARLTQSGVVERQNEDSYYILGQWNVLLSAAVRSEQPANFWLAQRELGRRLAGELKDEPAASHLRRLDAVLAILASQGKSGRAEHELAKEVQLFRAYLTSGVAPTR